MSFECSSSCRDVVGVELIHKVYASVDAVHASRSRTLQPG